MSSGVERCRGVSSGVEGCRGVSRCRVWHLDTVEHGTSLDGVEGCRGVSRGVELVELAWGVEVSSRCRGLVSRCRGQGSGLSSAVRAPHTSRERRRVCGRAVPCTSRRHRAENPAHSAPTEAAGGRWPIATIVTKCCGTGSCEDFFCEILFDA